MDWRICQEIDQMTKVSDIPAIIWNFLWAKFWHPNLAESAKANKAAKPQGKKLFIQIVEYRTFNSLRFN